MDKLPLFLLRFLPMLSPPLSPYQCVGSLSLIRRPSPWFQRSKEHFLPSHRLHTCDTLKLWYWRVQIIIRDLARAPTEMRDHRILDLEERTLNRCFRRTVPCKGGCCISHDGCICIEKMRPQKQDRDRSGKTDGEILRPHTRQRCNDWRFRGSQVHHTACRLRFNVWQENCSLFWYVPRWLKVTRNCTDLRADIQHETNIIIFCIRLA